MAEDRLDQAGPIRLGLMPMEKPKYKVIAEELTTKIQTGELPVGARLPREIDLENQYSVSRITASAAIKELQNSGLVDRIKGAGTFVREWKDSSNGPYGIHGSALISVLFSNDNQFGTQEMLMGIEEVCTRDQVLLTIHNCQSDSDLERSILKQFLSQPRAGVLIHPNNVGPGNIDLYSRLQIQKIPMVLIDRRVNGLSAPLVSCDNTQGMAVLTAHLLEKGYRRIGFLCTSLSAISSEMERYQGYCQALVSAGIEVEQEWLHEVQHSNLEPAHISVNLTADFIDRALDYFLGLKKGVDAIMCINDVMALSLIKAAVGRGLRIPEDWGVTGFDDIGLATHVSIPLTTYQQPFREIGKVSAKTLLDQIRLSSPTVDFKAYGETIRIAGQLMARSST